MKSHYLDTCIWLNLFKKEERKGILYWKIAKGLIDKLSEEIIYSGFVLKELKYKLDEKTFREKRLFFKEFSFIKATKEDYELARRLESVSKISFFDCMHIAICKRIKAILVTRDKALIKFAKDIMDVNKPESIDC